MVSLVFDGLGAYTPGRFEGDLGLSLTMADNIPSEIAAMSFEEALAELENIVRGLESGQSKLDDSITAYERGAFLKQHCEAKLKDAKAKVDKISISASGEVTAEPAGME